jgi:mRNA interferase HigB
MFDRIYQIDIGFAMHTISLKMLREFWQKHPEAENALRQWHTVVEHAEFRDFNHVREGFNSADYVPPYTIFDVGGNNYRVVVVVRYRFKKVYVQQVMTHREYDDWNKRYRKIRG